MLDIVASLRVWLTLSRTVCLLDRAVKVSSLKINLGRKGSIVLQWRRCIFNLAYR